MEEHEYDPIVACPEHLPRPVKRVDGRFECGWWNGALAFGEMDEFVARAKERGARTVISRATGPAGVVVTLPPGWKSTAGGQE